MKVRFEKLRFTVSAVRWIIAGALLLFAASNARFIAASNARFFAAGNTRAQSEIANQDHDLPGQVPGLNNTCMPCHTPHKADTTVDIAPLWNHALTRQTFTMYTTLTGKTRDLHDPGRICLSCHGGFTAPDGSGGDTGSVPVTGDKVIGIDLRDDQVVYSDAQRPSSAVVPPQ